MNEMKCLKARELAELAEAYLSTSAKINAHALEALQELFHRIPFGTKVTLSNGKTATIKPFVQPEVKDGTPMALIDVTYDDGSGHFEFKLAQSGWEGEVNLMAGGGREAS